ncbi:hypothetical protein M422DRAFT_247645 [Sphaerobolus stellatus SS14]|nr:hypothetical protein M422DRAFT_247645 [Sphaerobolus stellatus SS14]
MEKLGAIACFPDGPPFPPKACYELEENPRQIQENDPEGCIHDLSQAVIGMKGLKGFSWNDLLRKSRIYFPVTLTEYDVFTNLVYHCLNLQSLSIDIEVKFRPNGPTCAPVFGLSTLTQISLAISTAKPEVGRSLVTFLLSQTQLVDINIRCTNPPCAPLSNLMSRADWPALRRITLDGYLDFLDDTYYIDRNGTNPWSGYGSTVYGISCASGIAFQKMDLLSVALTYGYALTSKNPRN